MGWEDDAMDMVKVTYEEDIVVVTLDRRSKRNAVNRQMVEELQQVVTNVQSDETLKAFVLTAEGEEAFCAGGDLKELHGDLSEKEAYALLSKMREVLYGIATLPVPTLAHLSGEARGGGCELASACDLRTGKADGRFGFVQGQLGIVPGWGGGALLYERISMNDAFNWLVRSEMISASEALRIGWLQEIREEPDFSIFTERSQEQLKFWKKQLLEKTDRKHLYGKMEEETRQAAALWESEAHKEAVRTFFSKNKEQ